MPGRMNSLVILLLALLGQASSERSFMLTNFERIRVEGPFDVTVTTGGATGARASGDRRALDRMNLRVDGSTLVISAGTSNSDGWQGSAQSPTVVRVTVPRLRGALVNGGGRLNVAAMAGQRVDLGVNGSGTLAVTAVTADQLTASLTGTGTITLTGKAGRATYSSYGAGTIDAAGLAANDITVRADSSGDSSYAARFTAQVYATGIGTVRVAGKMKCIASGSGPVACGENVERRR